jgi:alkyldihydroxyacetonephosphate synthase
MSERERRWNGWGYADTSYSLEHRPQAWPYLADQLGLAADEQTPPVARETIVLRPSRLPAAALSALHAALGEEAVLTGDPARLAHSLGQSYRDLIARRSGQVLNPTDAVALPASEAQVQAVLQIAAGHGLAVVPFGGGTSVVGGVEPHGPRPTVTLSLARLNQVLAIDPVSQTVTAQAGILGPDLERVLNARGLTLAHSPQSFEFSSLGGWIAARSAGQSSTKYGKIEDKVISLRMVTPAGVVETPRVPASAAGPSLLQLLVGSEGLYGVITQATLRLVPLPAAVKGRAFLFKSFARGQEAVRALMQAGLVPAVVRLSDEAETRTYYALRERARGWPAMRQQLGLVALQRAGQSFEQGAALIVRLEGQAEAVRAEWAQTRAVCRAHGGFDLGQGVARGWYRDRYHTPYLRDVLLDRGLLLEVVETATEWDNVLKLHAGVQAALAEAITATGSRPLVMCHLSHAYSDGASLYFTFLAQARRGGEVEQWQAIKRAATDCILRLGGTVSHHHGVGVDSAPWMGQEAGAAGLLALRAVKAALDPAGVMNPGKVLSLND